MKFFNKLKWILGIIMVFVIIVTTNLIDRNSFIRVKDSVETIYEDRLVAYDLIYHMSEIVQEKELAFVKVDSLFFRGRNNLLNESFENKVLEFEGTQLTENERKIFDRLRANFSKVMSLEKPMINSRFKVEDSYGSSLAALHADLNDLSEIQLHEASKQLSISRKAVDTVELFTHLEIYVLIIMAIIIQVLILYRPKN